MTARPWSALLLLLLSSVVPIVALQRAQSTGVELANNTEAVMHAADEGAKDVWSWERVDTPKYAALIKQRSQSNDTIFVNASHSSEQEKGTSFLEYCLAHRNTFAELCTLSLYALVCVVGTIGNTLVIYVVLRFSKMQTVTNIYILNLAVADECFLIGIPFLLYTMRACSWTFGEFVCKAYMVSTSITQFTSSIFLLIMSADRYIAVCHPIASPKYRTLHIAKLVSAGAWLMSAVLMLPVILYASTVAQEDEVHLSCSIDWPEAYQKQSGSGFLLYTFCLGFATPLSFILCFYCLVIRKLQSVGPKCRSREKRRTHRKVTRLVLTVITVYILCWLPHWIAQLAMINAHPMPNDLTRWQILLFLLLGCLAYSNSAMNPILYAFLSDNFRKSFFNAVRCTTSREMNAQLRVEPSVMKRRSRSYQSHLRRSTAKIPKRGTDQKSKKRQQCMPTTSSTTTTTSAERMRRSGTSSSKRESDSRPAETLMPTREPSRVCMLVGPEHPHQSEALQQTEL